MTNPVTNPVPGTRRPRRWRALKAVALALTVLAVTVPGASTATQEKAGLPVELQQYSSSGFDPYSADTSSLHVSVTGGSESTRSYARVAFDRLPEGAKVSRTFVNLTITSQSAAPKSAVYPTYNLNSESAIVQACVLTEALPEDVDDAAPPPADCSLGSSTGTVLEDGTWQFDLTALVPYWHEHGNTGFALVPVVADPQATWAVSFLTTASVAGAVYRAPAVDTEEPATEEPGTDTGSGGGSSLPPVSSGGSGSTGASSGLDGGGPATSPVTTDPPAGEDPGTEDETDQAVATPTAPGAAVPPTTQSDTGRPWWAVVLVGLLVAGAAVAIAHRSKLQAALVGPLVTGFRAHPAPYALATAAVVWTATFGAYSYAHRPDPVQVLGQPGYPGGYTATGPGAGATAGPGGLTVPAVGAPGTSTPGGGSSGSSASGGGETAAGGSSGPAGFEEETAGAGRTETISGVPVFFPADGGPPVAQLYEGDDAIQGITDDEITLCAHAATTYGDAFNITPADLNVWWEDINAKGGINGRKITVTYENDNYDPGTAVQAAQKCMDKDAAAVLGGIGFDQAPAVRQWAEQNRQLYFSSSAVKRGSEGLKYTFAFGAAVEQFGVWFAQIVDKVYPGKKVAILWRQSPNWQPARDVFLQTAEDLGIDVVADFPVQINQANYQQQLLEARNAGAEAVFALENSLTAIQMVKQAQAQNWYPGWALVGANIITNTLGESALDQPIVGTSLLDYYTPGYYGGGYAPVAQEIQLFERMYADYRPDADLGGPGGDILFSNWEAQRVLTDLLETCGPECTRNKLAGILLSGYRATVKPLCEVNFGVDDHHWGYNLTNWVEAFKAPNGRIGWQVLGRCREDI